MTPDKLVEGFRHPENPVATHDATSATARWLRWLHCIAARRRNASVAASGMSTIFG